LASSLVPIAPIGIKNGKYYSKLVEHHDAFSESSEKNTELFSLAQYVLFRDTDKPGNDRPNTLGGVSFDFDYANVPRKYLAEGIKDWADLAKAHGLQSIEDYLKQKHIL
jgi:hypothetical protein